VATVWYTDERSKLAPLLAMDSPELTGPN
jgi:hypothetical protein